MSLIHRNHFPFFFFRITEYRTSKLQMFPGEQDFPWSSTRSFVVQPYVDKVVKRFPLHIFTVKHLNGKPVNDKIYMFEQFFDVLVGIEDAKMELSTKNTKLMKLIYRKLKELTNQGQTVLIIKEETKNFQRPPYIHKIQ